MEFVNVLTLIASMFIIIIIDFQRIDLMIDSWLKLVYLSYWSSYCEAKKSYGVGCASNIECLESQGLSCTCGICQCSSTK